MQHRGDGGNIMLSGVALARENGMKDNAWRLIARLIAKTTYVLHYTIGVHHFPAA